MAIVQRMREQLKVSMKAKDAVETQFLRYWIAQFTKGDGTELSDEQAMKKMKGILNEATTSVTSFSPAEIELMRAWVPPNLSPEQIEEELVAVAEQIKTAPKEGMAMGIAMKALAGRDVDSEDVKKAVTKIRG
jgi:uncharacterized protein